MIFPTKKKGFFFERHEHGIFVARTSAFTAPLVIEEIKECGADDPQGFARIRAEYQAGGRSGSYMHSVCGISPASRVVQQATLDLKRVREPNYLTDFATVQLKLELPKLSLAVIGADTGVEFEPGMGASKNVVFCGLPTEEVIGIQEGLLESGVFPERLEIGTVAALGALIDYQRFSKSKLHTLALEVGRETTRIYIVSETGIESSRVFSLGLDAMVPIVQKELGLKDGESARKLFYSNAFDFTGMGPVLVKQLLKELQSSIGFYEVQTGQSVGRLVCTVLPPKLGWLEAAIAAQLGVPVLQPDMVNWLQTRQIALADTVPVSSLDSRKFGLLGLMIAYSSGHANAA